MISSLIKNILHYFRKTLSVVGICTTLRSLATCRYFCKDMQISMDKKSNIEYLEKEFGLHKFLPKSVLDAIKPKVLKKAIQQQFKKVILPFIQGASKVGKS